VEIKKSLRRMIFALAATRRGVQMFYLYVKLIDMPISRLSNGKFIPSAKGDIMPIHFLTTTGAKSKTLRSVPVLCIPDGDDLILVASNWGKNQNPSWVYNLRAHPNVRVQKGKTEKDFVAHELYDNDRGSYWQKAIAFYPPYIKYALRSGRLFPIFLLKSQ
jgi:F420H(2)-dependent quinone reductase